MLVSWKWLNEYVDLTGLDPYEMGERLALSGLNLEGIVPFPELDDFQIDLEVTSNRGDCLGHIGVAREIAVLTGRELKRPNPQPQASGPAVSGQLKVENRATEFCPQYTARKIQGVKVGPSPDWLKQSLEAIGINSINNVVDITNYVLMECGQPLHAFDASHLQGETIIVRTTEKEESITAINGKKYTLPEGALVIADEKSPVAVAGVMGGLDSEIGDQTVDVIVESAKFIPSIVRSTARNLALFSDSSFRFERNVDLTQLDYASRRCCQLILDLAGGTLCEDVIEVPEVTPQAPPCVTLRYAQIERLLGITIPAETVQDILTQLGLTLVNKTEEALECEPPTWRADLTREADLIEEVARIYGYDKIPEDVAPPVACVNTTDYEEVADQVHNLLNAAGLFETITFSFVSASMQKLFQTDASLTPLEVVHSSRKQEAQMRQSLLPSLLTVRRENERKGSHEAQVYEISRVFRNAETITLEGQPILLSLVSCKNFVDTRTLLEQLVELINPEVTVSISPLEHDALTPGRAGQLQLNGENWGLIGELSAEAVQMADLRETVIVAELDMAMLVKHYQPIKTLTPPPTFPAMTRDLNFELDESVSWHDLESVVREHAGEMLESVSFASQYRGSQLGANRKSYVLSLSYRAADRTLTGEEVDQFQQKVVSACESQLNAQQR